MKNTELKALIMEKMEQSEDFAKAFVACEDAQAMTALLQSNGIDITEDQVNALFSDGVQSIEEYNRGELSEEQLDDVAGGGFWRGTGRFLVSCAAGFGYGCLCGVCPAASAGAGYVAVGLAAWTTAGYMRK